MKIAPYMEPLLKDSFNFLFTSHNWIILFWKLRPYYLGIVTVFPSTYPYWIESYNGDWALMIMELPSQKDSIIQ